jgi:hypothetical protein
MAKKTPAKNKKKSVKKKRLAAPKTLTAFAAHVFAECAFATAQGMDEAMAGDGRKYFLNPEAREYWLRNHSISIPRALRRPGANWDRDRQGVLVMASELGRVAITHALVDAAATAFVEVKKAHVEQASKDIKDSTRCRAAAKMTAGGGPFCAVV